MRLAFYLIIYGLLVIILAGCGPQKRPGAVFPRNGARIYPGLRTIPLESLRCLGTFCRPEMLQR